MILGWKLPVQSPLGFIGEEEGEALRCQTTYQGPPERLGFQQLLFPCMAGVMGLRVPAVGYPDEFVPTCGIGRQINTLRGGCPLSRSFQRSRTVGFVFIRIHKSLGKRRGSPQGGGLGTVVGVLVWDRLAFRPPRGHGGLAVIA